MCGDRDAHSFIDACRETGGPDGWFDDAKQVGLLASFDAASSWVTHSARDGVALIGDAAGTSDPAYGCGLSLTLRDVRVLRDHLRAESDWRRAADRYATDHDQYFDAMKRIIDWRTEMNHSTGHAADARPTRPVAQPPRSFTRLVRGTGDGETPGQPEWIAFDGLDMIASLRVEDFITAQRADWR